MRCEEAREKFLELFKNGEWNEIGRLYKELKGREKKCFESGALELKGQELEEVKRRLINALSATEGKERRLSHELIERILTEAMNVHLVRSIYRKAGKEYPIFSLIVRFRNGKQRTIKTKSAKERERAYELYGLLKTYLLNTVNT